MTEQNSTWWKIVAKWIGRVKSFLSSEKVDSRENALAQVQQQIASLQQQVESISPNIPNQIEEAVQKQLTQMTSSKIDSLEKAVTQLQQQVTHLQQQLESVTANIPNQIEEAVQKHLTQLNLSSLSTSVNKSSPQILLNKTTFAPTEEIQVSFVALSTFASNAWVGIIPSDIPHGSEAVNDQHDLSYQYLNGRTSGTLVFKAPTPNGSYDLRMNDTGKEVASTSFHVGVDLSSVQLQLNKTTFAPTEEIQVSFVALSTFASNAWVGIIPSNIPHGSEAVNDQHDLSYQYLNGRTSGTLVFKAPTPNGSYDLRMHDTDSNGQEVYSVSFEVRQN